MVDNEESSRTHKKVRQNPILLKKLVAAIEKTNLLELDNAITVTVFSAKWMD